MYVCVCVCDYFHMYRIRCILLIWLPGIVLQFMVAVTFSFVQHVHIEFFFTVLLAMSS